MRRDVVFAFIPLHAQRWLVALGLSALAHGGLLLEQRPTTRPATTAAVLQTRTIAAVPAAAPAAAPAVLTAVVAEVAAEVVTAVVTAVEAPAPLTHPLAVKTKSPRPLPAPIPSFVTSSVTSSIPSSITLPAAADLHYLLRQGGQEGTARLSWQPQDNGGYQLSLARELAGRALPTWRSEGETGAEGLAPSRFAQQRKGRDTSATNFRRAEGLISFSASAEQFAITPGVQDRLSGWLQLAGVIAAAPTRYPPGSELRLNVVGLRGEAREWVFEVLGLYPVTLADGQSQSPPALHLRRAPLGAYEGGFELWLAPERGYLPVRVLIGQLDERGWELLLLNDP